MGDVLAAAGHNVTIIRLQTLEYEKTKIKSPQKPGVDEWMVNGLVDGMDYNRIKTITSMSAFTDDSVWTMLSKEKREMMSAMMQTFVGGCESKSGFDFPTAQNPKWRIQFGGSLPVSVNNQHLFCRNDYGQGIYTTLSSR